MKIKGGRNVIFGWKEISPNDSYQMSHQKPLSLSQTNILQMLYQPIIGVQAESLYEYLANNHRIKQNYYLNHLFSVLGMGIPDFYQARLQLEGIGLLKTFKKKTDYIFKLAEPLKAQDFFENEILRHLLIHQVGEPTYLSFVDFFDESPIDDGGYEDISKSFTDVFHYRPSQEDLEESSSQLPRFQVIKKGQPQLHESQSTFEWNLFVESMSNHFVNRSSLLDISNKETILFLHECYGIDEMDMQNLVLMASDTNTGVLDKQELSQLVRKQYQVIPSQRETQKEFLTTKDKEAEQKENQNLTLQEKQLVEASQMNSPIAFASSVKQQKGGYISNQEKYVIEEVTKKSQLKLEVINILIHYILVIKDNESIHANFAHRIANRWAQNKVRSAVQAIEEVKKSKQEEEERNKQPRQNNYRKPSYTRTEPIPKWAQEGSKNKKDQPMTQKQVLELQERLKRMRESQVGKEGE